MIAWEAIVHYATANDLDRGICIAVCETPQRAERALDAYLDGLEGDRDDIIGTGVYEVEIEERAR